MEVIWDPYSRATRSLKGVLTTAHVINSSPARLLEERQLFTDEAAQLRDLTFFGSGSAALRRSEKLILMQWLDPEGKHAKQWPSGLCLQALDHCFVFLRSRQ